MGLLDDAIREHLELKRRHGAPDTELEQAEQEALGPARRDAVAEVGVPPLDEVPGEEVADVMPPPPPPPPADDPVFADEPVSADEPELEEAPPPGTPKPHGDPALGDYAEPVVDVDEPVVDPEEPAESEDVLEETPEFLQETPEHDKLWFEQKPPRDFDFE
jgi:hypothetical protein